MGFDEKNHRIPGIFAVFRSIQCYSSVQTNIHRKNMLFLRARGVAHEAKIRGKTRGKATYARIIRQKVDGEAHASLNQILAHIS